MEFSILTLNLPMYTLFTTFVPRGEISLKREGVLKFYFLAICPGGK